MTSANPTRDGGSRAFDFLFRHTPTLLTRALRRLGVGSVEELVVTGRRSGRERRVLVTATTRGGHWYVGHPYGSGAGWVRNVLAADVVTLRTLDAGPIRLRPVVLESGEERDRAVEDSIACQPFPMSILYRRAGKQIHDAGTYFRLERPRANEVYGGQP